MAITDVKGIADAYAEGRWGITRFIKTGSTTSVDNQWLDWAYTAGQPGYDSRIGTALTFTPFIADRNDAVWFPSIPAGQTLYLTGWNFHNVAAGNDQISTVCMMYDLVGVYPLIDGDTLDVQTLINNDALPRYADGAGLEMVIVNHVAPSTGSGGTHTLIYDDADGIERTTTFSVHAGGVGRVCSRIPGATVAQAPTPFIRQAAGARGVRRVKSVQFGTAPSGLWAIYIVKPLAQMTEIAGAAGVNTTAMTTMCFCIDGGFTLPQIPTGAHLGFFYLNQGGTRSLTSVFGQLTFCYG